MSPEERDKAFLFDMLSAAQSIAQILHNLERADYDSNEIVRSAVERKLEIVGEASRRLSAGFRESHPEIPWRSIIGLRNVLLHEYGEIDPARIWKVVTSDVPQLIRTLELLLPPSGV